MLDFPVSHEKKARLARMMRELGVSKDEVSESFIRSSGKGGQNVNKVATCVRLKHLPSGTEVKCGQERSQALNRFLAWRRLLEKLEEQRQGRRSAEQARREKIRRQKRRRSRRAREKMLREKKEVSKKKQYRRKPDGILDL